MGSNPKMKMRVRYVRSYLSSKVEKLAERELHLYVAWRRLLLLISCALLLLSLFSRSLSVLFKLLHHLLPESAKILRLSIRFLISRCRTEEVELELSIWIVSTGFVLKSGGRRWFSRRCSRSRLFCLNDFDELAIACEALHAIRSDMNKRVTDVAPISRHFGV